MLTTIDGLLGTATMRLDELRRGYRALARAQRRLQPAIAEFADFLASRERDTIAAIAHYRQRNEHRAALDVHVRLGAGFPFDPSELRLPSLPSLPPSIPASIPASLPASLPPSLEELIELATRTDELLAHLGPRVELYAAGAELRSLFDAIDELVGGRRRELAAALQELEAYQPSSPRTSSRARTPKPGGS